jgi:hypothetical protein
MGWVKADDTAAELSTGWLSRCCDILMLRLLDRRCTGRLSGGTSLRVGGRATKGVFEGLHMLVTIVVNYIVPDSAMKDSRGERARTLDEVPTDVDVVL